MHPEIDPDDPRRPACPTLNVGRVAYLPVDRLAYILRGLARVLDDPDPCKADRDRIAAAIGVAVEVADELDALAGAASESREPIAPGPDDTPGASDAGAWPLPPEKEPSGEADPSPADPVLSLPLAAIPRGYSLTIRHER